jgi:hypothetical protein
VNHSRPNSALICDSVRMGKTSAPLVGGRGGGLGGGGGDGGGGDGDSGCGGDGGGGGGGSGCGGDGGGGDGGSGCGGGSASGGGAGGGGGESGGGGGGGGGGGSGSGAGGGGGREGGGDGTGNGGIEITIAVMLPYCSSAGDALSTASGSVVTRSVNASFASAACCSEGHRTTLDTTTLPGVTPKISTCCTVTFAACDTTRQRVGWDVTRRSHQIEHTQRVFTTGMKSTESHYSTCLTSLGSYRALSALGSRTDPLSPLDGQHECKTHWA